MEGLERTDIDNAERGVSQITISLRDFPQIVPDMKEMFV